MARDVNGQRHDRTALVLYGSETGNSQDVAEELGRVAERLHFMTRVCEMDAIDLNILLRFTIVIFVTSTTGQGEFPKNAQKFWKSLLRKRLPSDCLDHVQFTTFGLGDSSYAQFNYAARKLHKRLEQLGAKEVYPRGEADERHDEGIDGTFLSWSADFRKHLLSTFPLPEGVTQIPFDVLLPPKILLELSEDSEPNKSLEVVEATNPSTPIDSDLDPVPPSAAQVEDPSSLVSTEPIHSSSATIQQDPKMMYEPPPEDEVKGPEPPSCPMLKEEYKEEPEVIDSKSPPAKPLHFPDGHEVKLISNKRVTPDTHWQDVRLLTFHIDADFDYYVGDTITIFPKNFPDDVQAVIDMMGWHEVADKEVRFNNNGHFPEYEDPMSINNDPQDFLRVGKATLRDLLIHSLDITAIPKRHFFEMAANHCDDEVHKLRLQEFASAEYRDEYYDYATRPRRSIIEVLHDFPSVKFPWQWALAVFPAIRGRPYSICSAGGMKQNPDGNIYNIEILVALVKYKTVLKKVRQGLCSRYLDSLKPGTYIYSKLSETNMRSPWVRYSEKSEWLGFPVICVAPGTGIAPCRALIWERARMEWERRNRYLKMDRPVGRSYVFFGGRNKKADFFFEEEYKHQNLHTTVFSAFSRDQKEKRYVQDVLKEQGQLITDLILNQEARIFVCGSSGNMPKSVRATFVDILEKWDRNKRGRAFAEAVVADLEKYKRYTQETW